jgi:hypothetical protein
VTRPASGRARSFIHRALAAALVVGAALIPSGSAQARTPVVQTFAQLPPGPWRVNEPATVAGNVLTLGPYGYVGLFDGSASDWSGNADNSLGWSVEARMRLDESVTEECGYSEPARLWAGDYLTVVTVGFARGQVCLTYPDQVVHLMDTQSAFHTYKLEVRRERVRLSVDGRVVIDHTLSWSGGGTPALMAESLFGTSHWQYLRYDTTPSLPRCTMRGTPGPDRLAGGPGSDVICGRDGADFLSGGGGYDTADYRARTTPVTVSLDGQANDGDAGERDQVGRVRWAPESEFETVLGGAGADTLTGDNWRNSLTGGAGTDVLRGLGGEDSLNAADGAPGDVVDGGDSIDSCLADPGDTLTSCNEPRCSTTTMTMPPPPTSYTPRPGTPTPQPAPTGTPTSPGPVPTIPTPPGTPPPSTPMPPPPSCTPPPPYPTVGAPAPAGGARGESGARTAGFPAGS